MIHIAQPKRRFDFVSLFEGDKSNSLIVFVSI